MPASLGSHYSIKKRRLSVMPATQPSEISVVAVSTSTPWAIGQVVKLKYEREHTSEALEIWAFYVLGCVHDARVQGVFSCVHGP